MANDRTSGDQQVSGWAIGGITFAAVAIMLIGGFQVIAGLAAIIDDEFFVIGRTTRSNSTRRFGDGSTC